MTGDLELLPSHFWDPGLSGSLLRSLKPQFCPASAFLSLPSNCFQQAQEG